MTFVHLMMGCLVAMILVVVAMPRVIPVLHKLKFGQVEREEGLASHKAKGGTPTMGGVVFILAAIIAVYVTHPQYFANAYVNIGALTFLMFGAIGFLDDFLIVVRHTNDGLSPIQKYGLQSLAAVIFYVLAWKFLPNFSTTITIPLARTQVNLGFLYPVLVYFMFTAESNAVNLTDGLDGLAAGVTMIALAPFIIFALMEKVVPVAVFAVCVIGALIGFLFFNYHPAKIFMGDCGSLALGALLAALAVFTKQELLLIVVGIVPLCETLSVIIQVTSFKLRKKRVFKMAPVHHHFEMCGWSETQVVTAFYFAGFIAGLIGILMGVL